MTKSTLHTLAAIAIGIASMVTISGCCDDDLANGGGGGGNTPFNPNIDQMTVKVTSDIPTAVLSSFDDNSMGAALKRRLSKTTTSIQADTKMVLIKGEDVKSRPITEWFEATKIYLKGGYIAVEKPHDAHLVEVMEQVSARLDQATDELITQDDGRGITVNIIPPNTPSSNSLNAEAERFKVRLANIETLASRSSTSENQPVAEMVIFARSSFFHRAPVASETSLNNYTSGILADGAAEWLNSRDALTSKLIMSRAGGSDVINDIMSASEEHTYHYGIVGLTCEGRPDIYPDTDFFQYRTKEDAYKETYRVWGVHDLDTNKDYYLVQQHATIAIGGKKEGDDRWNAAKTLYLGPYANNEWVESSGYYPILYVNLDGMWRNCNKMYGSWFNGGDFSMDLTGSGTIQVEQAIPETDNYNVSRTVAVGKSESQTNTIGATITGIFSAMPGGSVGLNYMHGWTSGTTYTMSTTTNTKELKCVKNTDGTKVQWTYGCGTDMLAGDDDEHPQAPDALINDVDIQNQVCWSVSNPEGQYTVNSDQSPAMACLVRDEDNGYKFLFSMTEYYNDEANRRKGNIGQLTHSASFTMHEPNRSQQIWHMDVDFPEIGKPGHEGQKGLLTQYLQNQFPEVYQPKVELADKTKFSENTIKNLVVYAKNMIYDENALQTLKGYAKDMGISQFTIKWYNTDHDDNDKEVHKTFEITIKAN